MVIPHGGAQAQVGGPAGYTYGAVAVLGGAGREELVAALRAARFSGWVGPAEEGWVLAVPARAGGVVAAGRRGVLELGSLLAAGAATVVAVRVLDDRQLALAVWSGGEEVGRYVSDPSVGLDDTEVLPSPVGAEHAEAFAAAVGAPPGAAEELEELLADELDPDSVIESERLAGVLRLLGLPAWLVSSMSLPRDVPGGPRAAEFLRLGAGVPGLRGRLLGRVAEVVRSRRRPPPVVTDPPRMDADPFVF